MATIIPFPARHNSPSPIRDDMTKLVDRLEQSEKSLRAIASKVRGSLPWAMHIVKAEYKARDDWWTRLHEMQGRAAKEHPRPKFAPAGEGYEGIGSTQARKILLEKILDLGPEEIKLARSTRAHDDAVKAWTAARETLREQLGVNAAAAERDALNDDADLARMVLDEAGIDWRKMLY